MPHLRRNVLETVHHKTALAWASATGPGAHLYDLDCEKGYFHVESNRVGFDSDSIDLSCLTETNWPIGRLISIRARKL